MLVLIPFLQSKVVWQIKKCEHDVIAKTKANIDQKKNLWILYLLNMIEKRENHLMQLSLLSKNRDIGWEENWERMWHRKRIKQRINCLLKGTDRLQLVFYEWNRNWEGNPLRIKKGGRERKWNEERVERGRMDGWCLRRKGKYREHGKK